jgi:hypothetical protein
MGQKARTRFRLTVNGQTDWGKEYRTLKRVERECRRLVKEEKVKCDIEVEVVRTVKQGHLRQNFVYQVGENPTLAPKITLRVVVKTAVEESEKRSRQSSTGGAHLL